MDLTIPHLLAYLLPIRYERRRNVHTGFELLKLRLRLGLLAFEASEHCYAVARSALGFDRMGRLDCTSMANISLWCSGQDGVMGLTKSDNLSESTILCQYTRIPMFKRILRRS